MEYAQAEDYVRVELRPHDLAWIEAQGRQRFKMNRARGWHSKVGTLTERWDVLGTAAEYACGLFYNLRVNTSGARVDINDGDLPGGIEVKSTQHADPRLNVNCDHLVESRPYVLVQTTHYPEAVAIIGCAGGQRIKDEGLIKKHREHGHEFYSLGAARLSKPMKLFDWIKAHLYPLPKELMFNGPDVPR